MITTTNLSGETGQAPSAYTFRPEFWLPSTNGQ